MHLVLLLLVTAGLELWPERVFAEGNWLDEPLASWNVQGMSIPNAAPRDGTVPIDPRCVRLHRPPETAEDTAVAAAGWTLYRAYQSGWGIRLVSGLTDHDGMCRPVNYQEFVFVHGIFAGTISPLPMNSRTDGAEIQTRLGEAGESISVTFARYAMTDPLCCPSQLTSVEYQITWDSGAPVVVPTSAFTAPQTP
jgi:hypothetical protein